MQVQVVGHDGGPDYPYGHKNHPRFSKVWGKQGQPHLGKAGLGLGKNENLDEVAHGDGRHEQRNYRLNSPHPELLQAQQQQHIQSGNDDGQEQWNMEQQVQGHSAAEHLCQVTGANGDFAHQPIGPASPTWVPLAAALGEILPGHHAQTRRDHL